MEKIAFEPALVSFKASKNIKNEKTDLKAKNDTFNKKNSSGSLNKTDKTKNNKFDLPVAAKNFFKGFVSPVEAALKHPIMTVATIAATTLLCSAIPVLAPISLVGFGVMAVAQLTKGCYGAIHNYKQGKFDDAENSFKDIGQGAISTLLTILGLKQAACQVKEIKLADELNTLNLNKSQIKTIKKEVDSSSMLSAFKEIMSLFTTKKGLKALKNQFKPRNILDRTRGTFGRLSQKLKKLNKEEYQKSKEYSRRMKLTNDELKDEILGYYNKIFDEFEIPEEFRPQVKVVSDKALKGAGYSIGDNSIEIGEKAFRRGGLDVEKILKDFARKRYTDLLDENSAFELRCRIAKEYFVQRLENSEIYSFTANSDEVSYTTTTLPRLNGQIKTDFINFARDNIYRSDVIYSEAELGSMVRPLVEADKEFCLEFGSKEEAVKVLTNYALSQQAKYKQAVKQKINNNILTTLSNFDEANSIKSCKGSVRQIDEKSVNPDSINILLEQGYNITDFLLATKLATFDKEDKK